MVYCCSYCLKKRVKGSGLRFFSFPKDEFLRNEWLKYCGFDIHDRNDTSKMKLCSDHFTATSFRITRKDGPLILNPGAKPTIVLKKLVSITSLNKKLTIKSA